MVLLRTQTGGPTICGQEIIFGYVNSRIVFKGPRNDEATRRMLMGFLLVSGVVAAIVGHALIIELANRFTI